MSEDTRPDPAEAEATGTATATVTFEGEEYQVPASIEDVDIEVIRAFERNAGMAIVEGILGPKQWARLERAYRKAHDGAFPQRALEPLVVQIADVFGFDKPGG